MRTRLARTESLPRVAGDAGVPALGYVLEYSALLGALRARARELLFLEKPIQMTAFDDVERAVALLRKQLRRELFRQVLAER